MSIFSGIPMSSCAFATYWSLELAARVEADEVGQPRLEVDVEGTLIESSSRALGASTEQSMLPAPAPPAQ